MWSSYVVPMWSLSVLYLSLENFFLVQFTTGFYYFFTFVFWTPRRDFMSFFVKNSKKNEFYFFQKILHIFFSSVLGGEGEGEREWERWRERRRERGRGRGGGKGWIERELTLWATNYDTPLLKCRERSEW